MSRFAVLVLVAVLGCRAPAQLPKAVEPRATDDVKLSADEQAVLDDTNAERKKAGLDPLTVDAKLLAAARGHAANMAKTDRLDHTLDGLTAADRVKAAGYEFSRTGENIAWNQKTPKAAVAGWMQSAGHKENLLNTDFTQIGVAAAKNAKGEPYWVQVFGTPKK